MGLIDIVEKVKADAGGSLTNEEIKEKAIQIYIGERQGGEDVKKDNQKN